MDFALCVYVGEGRRGVGERGGGGGWGKGECLCLWYIKGLDVEGVGMLGIDIRCIIYVMLCEHL